MKRCTIWCRWRHRRSKSNGAGEEASKMGNKPQQECRGKSVMPDAPTVPDVAPPGVPGRRTGLRSAAAAKKAEDEAEAKKKNKSEEPEDSSGPGKTKKRRKRGG